MCQKFVDQNKIQLEIGLPTSPFNLSVPPLKITGIRSKYGVLYLENVHGLYSLKVRINVIDSLPTKP